MAGMFDLNDLVWGTLNNFKDTLANNSGDPRRETAENFINAALRRTYGRDTLRDVTSFIGVVLGGLDTYQVSQAQKAGLLREYALNASESPEGLRAAYKVYIPEIEPSPAPKSATDPVLWFYPNIFPNDRVAQEGNLGIGDIVKVVYRDMENLIEPTIVSREGSVSLAFPSAATGGLPFKFKLTPAIPGYQRVGTHTTVPKKPRVGAKEFYGRLRASMAFQDYSREFLIGLTANANNESGFVENARGDVRSKGMNDYSIEVGGRAMCSFGYWQLNVCARGGGGRSFAKHFNIDLLADENRTPKGPLWKAITDEEKQFQFVASHLADYPTKYGTQDSVNWARLIAVEFEGCTECADIGAGPNDRKGYQTGWEQTQSRMNVAARLDKEIGADTGYTHRERTNDDGEGITSTIAPELNPDAEFAEFETDDDDYSSSADAPLYP